MTISSTEGRYDIIEPWEHYHAHIIHSGMSENDKKNVSFIVCDFHTK